MELSSNFSYPCNGSLPQHSPDFFHCEEIPIKWVCKTLDSEIFRFSFWASPKGSLVRGAIGSHSIAHFAHLYQFLKNLQTTRAFNPVLDPWRMIRKRQHALSPRGIRFVVHGSADGTPHPLIKSIAMEVQKIRKLPVDIEVLTSKKIDDSSLDSIWLVPLLLLPGSHTRKDIPFIASRLRSQGLKVGILPFLGSLRYWALILRHLVNVETHVDPVVFVHHPIKNKLSKRYTEYLSKELNVPVISMNVWKSFESACKSCFSPIPLFLAPNKMSTCMASDGYNSALLEFKLIRDFLIVLFGLLP